jgi:hypothetical protein
LLRAEAALVFANGFHVAICRHSLCRIADAVDPFSFGYDGKILAFAIPNSDPVAATVKDSEAETIALNWPVRFYSAQDVNFDGVELRTEAARFWLVRLASKFGPAHLRL